MYIPKHFEEQRIQVLHDLMRAFPLSTVVTSSSSGLNANHIPLQLAESTEPNGLLRGHVARANPLLDDIRSGVEALAIFHGPSAYITPSWYATKMDGGKVVPTWNYSVVHAYGVFRIVEDTSWLRSQLESLTTVNEMALPEPWSISDAPPDYIDQIMKAIVGVEMVITKLLGKWKVSQNQPSQNQVSVITGLKESGSSSALAMADLVENLAKDTH